MSTPAKVISENTSERGSGTGRTAVGSTAAEVISESTSERGGSTDRADEEGKWVSSVAMGQATE